MKLLRPSAWRWREGAGYYTRGPEELRKRPLLPDFRTVRSRKVLSLFDSFADIGVGSRVLELGCGGSRWLPYLAVKRGCSVVGIDVEPYAADLARTNLEGAGAKGEILCRDAFALHDNMDLLGRFDVVYSMGLLEHFDDPVRLLKVVSKYLRHGGRIITTVPNLRGVNWILQRLGDLEILETHVIYTETSLAHTHEEAGFETIASGRLGFYDGFMSAAGASTGRVRKNLHQWLCWLSNMSSEAWLRISRGKLAPELSWLSPYVFYVGKASVVTRSAADS
jgi:2-polyprenyl-6-hydroxyphenyl methylase/3-demethylubiquinone-9 3-methyltransferase